MIGRSVSHYQITDRLGQGGMGVVYKAHDTRLDRTIALKFLPPHLSTDDQAKARFMQEARAASKLDHPNICTIHDIGETDDGRLFIAMACYDGETLKKKIERGPLPVEQAIDMAVQIAHGLSRAHEAGIVHRDIKPANVMVTDRDEVKILDFGLAKLAGTVDLTKTGSRVGTAAYMSPEQARGEAVDARTDLWSLGVVLYEMLTGQRPFEGDYEQAVVYSILNEDPEPVTVLRSEVPAALERVVEKLLRKNSTERYRHAYALLADLQAIKTGSDVSAKQEGRSSIAVLPFENMSGDPEQEYFCDGLAEDLTNVLTKLNNLRVVARTSAFAFKGQHVDIRKIGRKLGVETVLEGSVRKAGNRLRITVQLVNVTDGYHLWSERYDRELEDVFAIQDEISLAIVDKLKIEMLGTEKAALVKRHTENVEAYHLYLKGRYFWNRRTEKTLKKAVSYFEQAIEVDPRYALAHVGIADYYLMLGIWGFIPAPEASAKVETAATKALEIDHALAEAHTSLAFWNFVFNWDWSAAERGFKQAIDLHPGYMQAHNLSHAYGIYLTLTGRFDEAITELKRVLELDPLSLTKNSFLGMALCYARRSREAADVLSKTLEMDPNYWPAHFFLGITRASEARYEEAFPALQKVVALTEEVPLMIGHLGCVYAMGGRREEALEMLGRLRTLSKERYVSPLCSALIHVGLGEKDQALADLESARRKGVPFMVHMRVTPLLDSLRSDPTFTALMSKVRGRA